MPPAPSGEGPLPLGPSEGIPLPPGSCKYQHDSPKRQEPVLRNLKQTPLAVPEGPLPASEGPLSAPEGPLRPLLRREPIMA